MYVIVLSECRFDETASFSCTHTLQLFRKKNLETRGVFRTQSKIYGVAFSRNGLKPLTISSIVDVGLSSKYASGNDNENY